jgi:hypothetical protein
VVGLRPTARLVLPLVVLVVLVCVSGCAVFTGKGTATGDLVVGREPSQVDGQDRTVIIPSGHLLVRTGTPVGQVADDDTTDLKGRNGPDGGGFVPIAWQFQAAAIPDPALATAGGLKPTQVSLRVGGTTYAVGSPYTVGADGGSLTTSAHNTFYVAVPDTSAAVSVVVGYDGVEQTVDMATGKIDAGVAAPYYSERTGAHPQIAHCSATGWHATRQFRLRMPCTVQPPRFLPYAEGLGWAKAGHVFASVAVDTTPYDVDRGRGTATSHNVAVQAAKDESTVDGRAPVIRTAADSASSATGSLAGTLVFDIDRSAPPQPLVLRRRITVESPGPGVPATFVASQKLRFRG